MTRTGRYLVLLLAASTFAMVTITVFPIATVHAQSAETYRDTFVSVSFGGNDGSLSFAGPWRERGEADGPGAGTIRVVADDRCRGGTGQCLRIGTDAGTLDPYAVDRSADLGAAEDATLRFSWRRRSQGQASGSVAVRISANGGTSWTTLMTLPLAGSQKQQAESIDIGPWMSPTTTIRFDGQGSAANGYIHFDDVEIAASIVPTVTTTTPPTPSTTTTTTIGTGTTTTTTPASTSTTTTTTTTTTTLAGSSSTTSIAESTSSTSTTSPSATTTEGSSTPTERAGGQTQTTTSPGFQNQTPPEGTTAEPEADSPGELTATPDSDSAETSAAGFEDAQTSSTDVWPGILLVVQMIALGLLIGILALVGVGRSDHS